VSSSTQTTTISEIRRRKAEVLSSLLRFEMKELLNLGASAVTIKPFTGNVCQNFEDPAALFHHALQILSLLSTDEVSERSVLDRKYLPGSSLDAELLSVVVLAAADDGVVVGIEDGNNGGGDSTTTRTSVTPAEVAALCTPLVDAVGRCKGACWFSRPVSEMWPELVGEYGQVVRHPMDLGTIKARLAAHAYADIGRCLRDVRLCFSNAIAFNGEGSELAPVVQAMERTVDAEVIKLLHGMSLSTKTPTSLQPTSNSKLSPASSSSSSSYPMTTTGDDDTIANRLYCRIIDMLSCIEAHHFCEKVLSTPPVDASIRGGRWSRLEDLCKEAADLEVRLSLARI
jgi:hypothetical protein